MVARRARTGLKLRSAAEFRWHVAGYLVFALGFLAISLGAGVAGYHWIVGLSWIDALLNASMILTGMGPVNPMPDDGSKLFASLYAIFGGAVYPAVTALVLYPFLHRMMMILHLQAQGDGERGDGN